NGTSFFTQHLIDGLLGAAADQDGDGYITFSELYAYVDRRLRGTGKQIPQRHVHGDGDVRLAKRPQPAPKVAKEQPSEEARPPHSQGSRSEPVTLPAIPPRESKALTLAPLYSFGMLSSLPFIVWFLRTKRFELGLRAVLYLAASTAFIIWSSKLGALG